MKIANAKERVTAGSKRGQENLTARGKTARKALHLATILVPVDYSPCCQSAFEYALDLAERFQSRVCLLHVIENRTSPDFDAFPLTAKRSAALANARRKLVAFARSGNHPFVPIFPEVRPGEPWREIISAAEKENVDLIVIPTHGRTGLKHALMGSVTERVVRHAPCPVLVLRNKQVDLLVTRRSAAMEVKL